MPENKNGNLSDRIFGKLPPPRAREREVVEVEKAVPVPLLHDIDIDGYWMGNFGITGHGIYIREEATEVEWYNACEATEKVAQGKDWGKADLCLFGIEMLGKTPEEVAAVVKVSLSSVSSYASVSRTADRVVRLLAPSMTHFRVVQGMTRAEQVRWLERARSEKWSLARFRKEVAKSLGVVRDTTSPKAVKKAVNQQKRQANAISRQAEKLPVEQRMEMAQHFRSLADGLEGGL